jgi:CotH kinase protein
VQDETLMHEAIGAELFRAAGVPAPRVTHARVWLNDRDLGLYVLKESFDKDFLKRHFSNAKGNLYEGGFCQEIDGELERDEGKGPDDRSDLAALADACKLEDAEERNARLAERLNIEHFLTFTALELCLGHWDGYVQNRNNYRVYFDPDDEGRARFLPHGMDQILGDPGASVLNPPVALVATAVMQNPAWRARYRERVRELRPLLDAQEKILPLVAKLEARLRPAVAALGEEPARAHAERVNELRERITARSASLAEQADAPEPAPVEFDDKNRAATDGWTARSGSGNAAFEDINEEGKPRRLLIAAGEGDPTLASWRTTVLLAPGNYTLHGRARTEDLAPVEDEKGAGAGLRISGAPRENRVAKDKVWTALVFEFTVDEQRQVELVAELRATAGKVWFEAGSLQLERRP